MEKEFSSLLKFFFTKHSVFEIYDALLKHLQQLIKFNQIKIISMKFMSLLVAPILILFCSCGQKSTTQIAENTFVYDSKVYKIVDNELTELADLNSKNIRKLEVLKSKQKSLGESPLSYIKENASAQLDALYRGNILYFKLNVNDFSDLKEKYNPGKFTIEFLDEFNFILSSVDVMTSDLIAIINEDGEITKYVYNGKVEMSMDINSEIKTFSISSTVKLK